MSLFRPKFEIYFSKANDWRWRLKAVNGEIIAVSEGYTSKQAAMNICKRIKELAQISSIEDIS